MENKCLQVRPTWCNPFWSTKRLPSVTHYPTCACLFCHPNKDSGFIFAVFFKFSYSFFYWFIAVRSSDFFFYFPSKFHLTVQGNILYRFPSLQRTAVSQRSGRKEYVGRKFSEWVGGVDKFFKERKWDFRYYHVVISFGFDGNMVWLGNILTWNKITKTVLVK